ncbi:MAG: hypothetical protein ACI8UO_006674, partial [Verrucomicrobiales bacterium]
KADEKVGLGFQMKKWACELDEALEIPTVFRIELVNALVSEMAQLMDEFPDPRLGVGFHKRASELGELLEFEFSVLKRLDVRDVLGNPSEEDRIDDLMRPNDDETGVFEMNQLVDGELDRLSMIVDDVVLVVGWHGSVGCDAASCSGIEFEERNHFLILKLAGQSLES